MNDFEIGKKYGIGQSRGSAIFRGRHHEVKCNAEDLHNLNKGFNYDFYLDALLKNVILRLLMHLGILQAKLFAKSLLNQFLERGLVLGNQATME